MSKFKCIKLGCEMYGKETITSTLKWRFSKETKSLVPDPPVVCPDCGSEMVFIKEKKSYIGIQVGKFSSLDDKGKKQLLLDRARNHGEKRRKEEREFRKKEVIKNYFKND